MNGWVIARGMAIGFAAAAVADSWVTWLFVAAALAVAFRASDEVGSQS